MIDVVGEKPISQTLAMHEMRQLVKIKCAAVRSSLHYHEATCMLTKRGSANAAKIQRQWSSQMLELQGTAEQFRRFYGDGGCECSPNTDSPATKEAGRAEVVPSINT